MLFKIRLFVAGLMGAIITFIGFYILLVLTDLIVPYTSRLYFLHINTILQILIGIIQMFALIGLGDIVGRFVSFFAKNRSSNLTRKVASFSYLFGCSIVVIFYFSNLKSENLSRNIFFKAVNIILSLIPSIILTLRTGRVEPLYTWILIIPRVIGMYAGSTQAYEQAS